MGYILLYETAVSIVLFDLTSFFFFFFKIFCVVNRCEYLCRKIICIHKDLCNNIMLENKTIISGNDENAPMGEL